MRRQPAVVLDDAFGLQGARRIVTAHPRNGDLATPWKHTHRLGFLQFEQHRLVGLILMTIIGSVSV